MVRRVFEQGAYADRALTAEARGLDPRDRALAMGSRTALCSAPARSITSRPLLQPPAAKLDAPVLAAMRLGLFQLLFLDGSARTRR